MEIFTVSANGSILCGATFPVQIRESDGLSYIKRPRTATSVPGDGFPLANELLTSGQFLMRSDTRPDQSGHFRTRHLLTMTAANVATDRFDRELLFPPSATEPKDAVLLWFPDDWDFFAGFDPLVQRVPDITAERMTRLLMPGLVMLMPTVSLIVRQVMPDDAEDTVRPRERQKLLVHFWRDSATGAVNIGTRKVPSDNRQIGSAGHV